MITRRFVTLLGIPLALASCAPARSPTLEPEAFVLRAPDGQVQSLAFTLQRSRFTVVTFFSAHCPCQQAHDARLRALRERVREQGVDILVVDSEEGRTLRQEATEATERGYPIRLDERGQLARALGAEYATFSVVLDPRGRVLYRGGFDSDRSHLRVGADAFLANAVDELIAGRTVSHRETRALGCTLDVAAR